MGLQINIKEYCKGTFKNIIKLAQFTWYISVVSNIIQRPKGYRKSHLGPDYMEADTQ